MSRVEGRVLTVEGILSRVEGKMSRVHSLFFRKIIEIERFVLRAAILHECQNYLGGGGGLGGSEKNRGTVITSLQLAFRRRDRNFTPFTIH